MISRACGNPEKAVAENLQSQDSIQDFIKGP